MDQERMADATRTISRMPSRRKERPMKSYDVRTRIMMILLAALALGGSWLGQVTQPAAAIVPGANGRIAFQSDRDGDFEIYTISPKGELGKHGQKAKKLTSNNAADGAPVWSPNGKRIACESNRAGNPEIYVMNADGSDPTRLTTDPATDTQPAWSPDATRIAFMVVESVTSSRIFRMAADGSNRRRLTKGGANNWYPDWQAKP